MSVFTNTIGGPTKPLTLDTLQAMLDAMPPKQTYLASRLFPADKAFVTKGDREHFWAAHPAFWERARAEMAKRPFDQVAANPWTTPPLTVISIDIEPSDTPETADWRRRQKDRWLEALTKLSGLSPFPTCSPSP